MATLDTAAVLNSNVTVKYLGARGFQKEESLQLATAHRKAVEAVKFADAVLAGTKTSGVLDSALFVHFKLGSGAKTTLPTITANVTAILNGISTGLTISDVNERSGVGTLGYVVTTTDNLGNVVKRGSIHIEFNLLKQALRPVVSMTIIHEASHKFCGTKDHAYAYDPDYKRLTKAQAADNADSYAYFCWSLYLGRVVTDKDALAIAFKRLHLGIL
jgi:hypothetical protein